MSLLCTGAGTSFSTSYTGGSLGPVKLDLAMYVDALDSGSYPGSGTTWYDLTENGNDLAIQNSMDVQWLQDSYFNTGESGYFSRGSLTGVNVGGDPYTYQICVRRSTGSWEDGGLWCLGYVANNKLNAGWTRVEAEGRVQNSWWSSTLTADFTDVLTAWFVVTATYDGSTRKIYQNGTLVSQDGPAPTLDIDSTDFKLCEISGFTGYKWNSDVSAFLIYNRALSPAEVASNSAFLLGRVPSGPTPPLPASTMVWDTGSDPLVYEHPVDIIIY